MVHHMTLSETPYFDRVSISPHLFLRGVCMVTFNRFASLLMACILVTMSIHAEDESSSEPLSIGILLGPSIPSQSINSVYDALANESISAAYDVASNLGYHAAAKLRFGLAGSLSFSGGVGFIQFPGQQISIDQQGIDLTLKTVTTYVPINAGLAWVPFQGFIRPYISAEAVYTYRKVSVSENSFTQDLINQVFDGELEPSSGRLGAAAGVGLELNLGGLRPFIEVKNTWTNLVTKEAGEPERTFLNVSVGLIF
jgi:hypothetical protein